MWTFFWFFTCTHGVAKVSKTWYHSVRCLQSSGVTLSVAQWDLKRLKQVSAHPPTHLIALYTLYFTAAAFTVMCLWFACCSLYWYLTAVLFIKFVVGVEVCGRVEWLLSTRFTFTPPPPLLFYLSVLFQSLSSMTLLLKVCVLDSNFNHRQVNLNF